MKHPALIENFNELYKNLLILRDQGLVYERKHPGLGLYEQLRLYNYSDECTYSKAWNKYTMMARGLILDIVECRMVSLPFMKFFNYQELVNNPSRESVLPDTPFEVFEKLDGSLIIIYWYNGRWNAATRGSFESDQALWAQALLDEPSFPSRSLYRRATYLCEAIYPENKIVVNYDTSYHGLTLLGGYYDSPTGSGEYDYEELVRIGSSVGWRVAERYGHDSISSLLDIAGRLGSGAEGFVLRFYDGFRVKIKGDEYCRIHRMVSRLTPIAIWEVMLESGDSGILAYRKELPEEFWTDFDSIVFLLSKSMKDIIEVISAFATRYACLSDKELGLFLQTDRKLDPSVRVIPEVAAKFLFPYRKGGMSELGGKSLRSLFEEIRPTANKLEGYIPGKGLNRVQEEEN